jgi:uncharacterized protein DUF4157
MAGAPEPPEPSPGVGQAPGSADAPVRIDRSESGAAAASDLHANAFTSGSTIVLPSGHGPVDRGRGQSLLAHELVHVAQQRRLGAALPHESSSAGRELEQEARSAEHLVTTAAASRQRSGGLPLARSTSSQAAAGAPLPAVGASADVRSAIDGALTLARPAHSQPVGGDPAAASGGAFLFAEAEGGVSPTAPQRADTAAPTSGPTPGAGPTLSSGRIDDPSELDELAHKLYERIRHRLGRELLLDRERSGLLTGSR